MQYATIFLFVVLISFSLGICLSFRAVATSQSKQIYKYAKMADILMTDTKALFRSRNKLLPVRNIYDLVLYSLISNGLNVKK